MSVFRSFWFVVVALLLVAIAVLLSIYLGWLEALWDWLREGIATQMVTEEEIITTTMESNSTTIRNVGLVVGGIIAIGLAVWRSRVAERQADAAQQQAIVSQQQADLAQRGLLNERYQKGAEMLGSDVLSVQMGGIFALQWLAEEHSERYHVQIMRLLCAFVRNLSVDSDLEGSDGSRRELAIRESVQAAMNIIGKRNEIVIENEKANDFEIDLRSTNLSQMNLQHLNLSGANLDGANLGRANLVSTNLSGAKLHGTFLGHARLSHANLYCARLRNADLHRAILIDAKLVGAHLDDSCLRHADLMRANLSKAKLPRVDLTDAYLLETKFPCADLTRANLTDAYLKDTDLYCAQLWRTNLSGTELVDTNSSLRNRISKLRLTQGQLGHAARGTDTAPKWEDEIYDVNTGKPLIWHDSPFK